MALSLFFPGSEGFLPPSERGLADAREAESEELARIGAFTERWVRCQPTVRAYLASFLPDSLLDDCIQEIALIAWRKGPLGEEESDFMGHCLACARRVGLAAQRKRGRDRLQFLSPDVAQALADTVALRESSSAETPRDRVEALRQCLAQLKPQQRQLITIRYEGEGTGSLGREAERLGRSADTLYKRLERLRGILRQCVTRRTGSSP